MRKVLSIICAISVILLSACQGNTEGSITETTTAIETTVEVTSAATTAEVVTSVSGTVVAPTEEDTEAVDTVETPVETSEEVITEATTAVTEPADTEPTEVTTVPETSTAPITITEAAPEWTEEAYNATMYIIEACNSRIKPIQGSTVVKSYKVSAKVEVTAKCSTGYFKIASGDFIHGDFLSSTKPAVTTAPATTTKAPETTPEPSDTGKYVDMIPREPDKIKYDGGAYKDTDLYDFLGLPDNFEGYGFSTREHILETWKGFYRCLTAGTQIPTGWYVIAAGHGYTGDDGYCGHFAVYGADGTLKSRLKLSRPIDMGYYFYLSKGDTVYATGSFIQKVSDLGCQYTMQDGNADAGGYYESYLVGSGNELTAGTYKIKRVHTGYNGDGGGIYGSYTCIVPQYDTFVKSANEDNSWLGGTGVMWTWAYYEGGIFRGFDEDTITDEITVKDGDLVLCCGIEVIH